MNDLADRLLHACVGGCSCLTKTPEVRHHAPDCNYRLFSEAHDAVLKLEGSRKAHDESADELQSTLLRLDSLQAGVRNYLNATELDENGPAWYLLHGALANSSFVVERQSPK